MLRTRIRNNGSCRQVATPLLDDVGVDVLSLRPKDTKMAGTIQQAKESWARPHCPTPSLHRDESVLHIPAAIAQPEPLDNDDRKLVPSPKAHRPTKSPGTWGKGGCISGGNFTGACYTLPPYIAKKNNIFVHHLQFLVVPRDSPDSNNLAATPCYHPHGGIDRRQTSVKPLSPCRCQCAMQAKLSFVAVTAGLGSLPSLTVGLEMHL